MDALYTVTLWYALPINSLRPTKRRNYRMKIVVLAPFMSAAYDRACEALRGQHPAAELQTENGREMFQIDDVKSGYVITEG